VLVYAHDRSAGDKYRRANELLEELTARNSAAVSIQVLQEFFTTVTGRITKPLPAIVAAAIIADVGTWTTHAPEVGDVLAAIDLRERFQLAFWDAMILRSAARLGCAVLWSEDLSAGQHYGEVAIKNPFG